MAGSLPFPLDRWLARRSARREMPVGHRPGVVSFSFDDVFRSACGQGSRILADHGCRGTFYVAGSLTGRRKNGRDYHTLDDLASLLGQGHQLGCHTFSHVDCARLTVDELNAEFDRNARFFSMLGTAAETVHFAFPYGAFGVLSKRCAAARFESSRITGGGMHLLRADLNGLQTEPLYEGRASPKRLRDLARSTSLHRGWLIFHCHDVQEEPSPWGCSPRTLEEAVRSALDVNCLVLTVAEAINYWRGRSHGE